MALIRQCARCMTAYNPYTEIYNALAKIERDMRNAYLFKEAIDLCPTCKNSFEDWMEAKIDRHVFSEDATRIIESLRGCANEECDGCYLEDNARTCACNRQIKLDAAAALEAMNKSVKQGG